MFCVTTPCRPIGGYHHFRVAFYTEDGGNRILQNISMQLWDYIVSRGVVLEMKVPRLSSMLFQVERSWYNSLYETILVDGR
jgi:hypothetical protein